MAGKSRLRRIVGTVVWTLNAAMALLVPVAEARAALESATAAAHVEERYSPTCPTFHDERACQFCRLQLLADVAPPHWRLSDDQRHAAPNPVGDAPRAFTWESFEAAPRAPPARLASRTA